MMQVVQSGTDLFHHCQSFRIVYSTLHSGKFYHQSDSDIDSQGEKELLVNGHLKADVS